MTARIPDTMHGSWNRRRPPRLADGWEFLELAAAHGVHATTHAYPVSRVQDALQDLKAGRFDGAVVLVNDA